MAIEIDWDNYEVIEAEDFTQQELCDTIEDVREALDFMSESMQSIPDAAMDILTTLTDLKGEDDAY